MIIELVMFFSGLWAVISGKLPSIVLGTKYSIEGTAARIIGILLILPLPIAFMAALILAFVGGLEQAGGLVTLIQIVTIIIALIAARIISYRVRKSALAAAPELLV
jgi:hypothetical protein